VELTSSIPLLLKRGHDVELQIRGKILTDAPTNLTHTLGVEHHVEFLGKLPRLKVFDYLKHANAKAHLCSIPGLGIARQEAMAVALPVVTPACQRLYGDVSLNDGKTYSLPILTINHALTRLYFCLLIRQICALRLACAHEIW
jgi:hypothetical protein